MPCQRTVPNKNFNDFSDRVKALEKRVQSLEGGKLSTLAPVVAEQLKKALAQKDREFAEAMRLEHANCGTSCHKSCTNSATEQLAQEKSKLKKELDPISRRNLVERAREIICGWNPKYRIKSGKQLSKKWKLLFDEIVRKEGAERLGISEKVDYVADAIFRQQNARRPYVQNEMSFTAIRAVVDFGVDSLVQLGNAKVHEIDQTVIRDSIMGSRKSGPLREVYKFVFPEDSTIL